MKNKSGDNQKLSSKVKGNNRGNYRYIFKSPGIPFAVKDDNGYKSDNGSH